MDRREMFGTMGAGAVALAALGWRPARAGQDDGHDHDHDHAEHDKHLAIMGECAKICNQAAAHCLMLLAKGTEGRELHAKSHQMAMDCQEFCVLAGTLMARRSPLAMPAHAACAEACRQCADACEGHKDELMKACVEICRRCEAMCKQMANKA